MPLSREHKLLLVHIPKNAGTSIEKSYGMIDSGHSKWDVYSKTFSEEWNTYKTFAVLRDPIDRFISAYTYASMEKSYWHSADPSQPSKYGKHSDYDTCSKYGINELAELWTSGKIKFNHPSWLPQYEWIVSDDKIMVEYLALFERLNEAMEILAPSVEMKTINKSSSKKKIELTEENIERLKDFYKIDYDLYNQMEGRALCRVDGEPV